MKPKFWQIFVCILIGIILAVGGVLGLTAIVKNARAVVRLGDVTVDSSTVTYLAALYKLEYLGSVDEAAEPSDTKEFWEKEKEEGLTYGEDFENSFKEYLAGLVADAYLYTVHHGYTPEDKLTVAQLTDKVLSDSAGGSVTEFNRVAKECGFDFKFADFQNAVALRYKAGHADEFLPSSMSEDEKAGARQDAISQVSFNKYYDYIDLIDVPMINEYYVK